MNSLCIKLAESKETFKECRIFMVQQLGKTKDEVIALENGSIENCISYYIKYLEYKELSILQVLDYFYEDLHNYNFWTLLLASINGAFKKIESGNINFIPF